LTKLRRGGLFVLLLILTAALLSGCMARGTVDTGWTALTVADSTLYSVRSSGEAVALDLEDEGSVLWKYPLKAPAKAAPGCGIAQQTTATEGDIALGAVYGSPTVSDGLMLFGSSGASLIALDAESGDPAWSYAVDSAVIGGVAVADGVAYIGTVGGQIHAVNLTTQEAAWTQPFVTGDRVWSTPLVDGSHLYVASMDHSVYALDRTTGEQVWSVDLGGAVQGDIALFDGTLLAGGVDRRLHAIKAATGEEIWATDKLGGWVWGAPLLSTDGVFFTTLDGKVHGHRASDGQALWAPVTLDGGISAGPVQAGNVIIVGTEKGLVYSIDIKAGSAEVVYGSSQEQQRGGYLSASIVENDVVYLGSTFGFIVALDPAARAPELWVYPSTAAE
jgi:outer membrane protein assembly factor BamB